MYRSTSTIQWKEKHLKILKCKRDTFLFFKMFHWINFNEGVFVPDIAFSLRPGRVEKTICFVKCNRELTLTEFLEIYTQEILKDKNKHI